MEANRLPKRRTRERDRVVSSHLARKAVKVLKAKDQAL
jgi:hypothetical protein